MFDTLPALLPDLSALYEDLHAHPELSFQEHRTAGIVADRLEALGYEVTRGVGGTGVVAVLDKIREHVEDLPFERDRRPVAAQLVQLCVELVAIEPNDHRPFHGAASPGGASSLQEISTPTSRALQANAGFPAYLRYRNERQV